MCWFLPYGSMNLPQVYICPFFLNLPPIFHPIPSFLVVREHWVWAPCIMPQNPTSYLFLHRVMYMFPCYSLSSILKTFEICCGLSFVTYLLTKAMLAGLQQDAASFTNRLITWNHILSFWPPEHALPFISHLHQRLLVYCLAVFLDSQIWNMPLLYAYATSKCRKNWHPMISGLLRLLFLLFFFFYKRKYWKDKTETKIVIWIGWSWEKHVHVLKWIA